MCFPRLIWKEQSEPLGGLHRPQGLGMGRGIVCGRSQSGLWRTLKHPSVGLTSFLELCRRPSSATRPPGCMDGWFRGRQTLWTASQAARGPAGGDSLGTGPRGREDGRVRSQPDPLGQDPLPAQHPQQGLCSGWAVQGETPCQRSLRQVHLQMSF